MIYPQRSLDPRLTASRGRSAPAGPARRGGDDDPPPRGLGGRAVAYFAVRDLIPLCAVYALLFSDNGLSTAEISSLLVIWSVTAFVLEVPPARGPTPSRDVACWFSAHCCTPWASRCGSPSRPMPPSPPGSCSGVPVVR